MVVYFVAGILVGSIITCASVILWSWWWSAIFDEIGDK